MNAHCAQTRWVWVKWFSFGRRLQASAGAAGWASRGGAGLEGAILFLLFWLTPLNNPKAPCVHVQVPHTVLPLRPHHHPASEMECCTATLISPNKSRLVSCYCQLAVTIQSVAHIGEGSGWLPIPLALPSPPFLLSLLCPGLYLGLLDRHRLKNG